MQIIRFMALQSFVIEDSVISHFWLHPEIGPARTENLDVGTSQCTSQINFYAFCKKNRKPNGLFLQKILQFEE